MRYVRGLTVVSLFALILFSGCTDFFGTGQEGGKEADVSPGSASTTIADPDQPVSLSTTPSTIDKLSSPRPRVDGLRIPPSTSSTTIGSPDNQGTIPDESNIPSSTIPTAPDLFLEHQLEYDFITTRLYGIDGKLTYQAHRKGLNLIRHGSVEFEGNYPVDVNGKLAYVAIKEGRQVVVHDSKYGQPYDSVSEPLELNGKLFYYAALGDKKIWVYDNREFTSQSGLAEYLRKETGKSVSIYMGGFIIHDGPEVDLGTHMLTPSIVNGKLAYNLIKADGESAIIYDEKSYGEEYDMVSWPVEVNGKLAYIAQVGNNTLVSLNEYLVVYDGVEQKRYRYVSDLCEINDKLTYVGYENGRHLVIHDGREGKGYEYIDSITSVGDKLIYRAREGEKFLIVYGDREISEYNYVQDPVEVDGKLVFYATRNDKKYIAIER